jgi:hypothetical protein
MALSERTLEYGHHVAGALLGVDALYRAESGDEEGLVVLDMSRPGELEPAEFDDYRSARLHWEKLRAAARKLPEPDRRIYYHDLCDSTLAFVTWRMDGLSFRDQLSGFLRVPAEPASEGTIEALRTELRGLLNGLGYPGDLDSQCVAWEQRNQVERHAIESASAGLMADAWERTEARLLDIPAPPSDAMGVVGVAGVPFNARCDYLRRTVELNTDPVLTRPGLKHLAVHEGCPGHYVQFKLRETWFREGLAPADVLLSVVNTASSSVFEGIADAGMEMVDWIDEDDRVQAVLNRYRAALGTAAAWRLHARGWSVDQVRGWLSSQSLMGGEGWVANRMAFISAPSRAVLIWSYWWGEPTVLAAWRRVPSARRAEFVQFLHGRMHSIQSIGMFESA